MSQVLQLLRQRDPSRLNPLNLLLLWKQLHQLYCSATMRPSKPGPFKSRLLNRRRVLSDAVYGKTEWLGHSLMARVR